MLTYEDICSLSDLTEDEVAAIAEHEHIPQICAAEVGYYLVHAENGIPMLRRIILDDIRAAKAAGNFEREYRLRLVLRHFIQTHPEHEAKPRKDAPEEV